MALREELTCGRADLGSRVRLALKLSHCVLSFLKEMWVYACSGKRMAEPERTLETG